jgi:uncharacterized protein YjbI with pentapeptide repeats
VIRRKDGTVVTDSESNIDLSEQNLQDVDFRNQYIEGGNLSDSDLRGSDFSGAHLYGTYLYRANCSRCNFSGATLQGVVLDEVNLTEADFTGAQLLINNMGGRCSLFGADMRTAKLENAILTGCKYDSTTLFPPDFDPESRGMVRAA